MDRFQVQVQSEAVSLPTTDDVVAAAAIRRVVGVLQGFRFDASETERR